MNRAFILSGHANMLDRLYLQKAASEELLILKKISFLLGFIRVTMSPTLLIFFHMFPIFLLALRLRPQGVRLESFYLLWNHLLYPPPSKEQAQCLRGMGATRPT